MTNDEHVARLHAVAAQGDTASVWALLGADPTLVLRAGEHGKTALHVAAEHDQVGVASLLLEAGADASARTAWGATALEWAATMGSRRVGAMLVARGEARPSLAVAAGLGMLHEVQARLAEGTRDSLDVALYLAARNGASEIVALLLDHGASVDAKGFFGGTALHWAAINGHADTVRLLLERGASRDVHDERFDATPHGWALEGGHAGIAALIGHGGA
jgi:ankyrin repeat protein